MKTALSFSIALVLLSANPPADACTNFLVTRGATVDGSTMITYAADAHFLYGDLATLPAMDHPPGSMRDIIEWDTGKYLGQIPEAPHTYAVIGNMNEHQVAVGETTYGGRHELLDPESKIDYGSLMTIAMQRAKTAREAVQIMGKLAEQYGYASEGESFSISDPKDVWIMDMIGKGPGGKGALWVARRIPNGYISAHANQSRIRRFPKNDPTNCLYSKDVISFARDRGYFNGPDKDFSFADAYAPLNFTALRICEARVWSFFRRVSKKAERYRAYAMGDAKAEALPLWIKPDRKLSVRDLMDLMRDHFENSPMDLHDDVGAGPYQLPYRWRPLFWEVDGVTYFNERSTSTQQTGFSFVAQSRGWLPDPIGGIFWFGVDDTNSTVYVPMYCGIHKAPRAYATGTADFQTFSWKSAFWVFNWVANFAYSRYRDMIVDIQKVQRELEGKFLAQVPEIDKAASSLYNQAPELARDYLTRYSCRQAQLTVERWRKLGEALLLKYLDGNVRDEFGKATHPGYPKQWYQRIVKETGDKFEYKKIDGEMGYYTSRKELGVRAKNVPKDFDFSKEKLYLLPGTAKCGQLPSCCLTPERDEHGHLKVNIKRSRPTSKSVIQARMKCGEPGWLIRVPKAEKEDVVPQYQMSPGK